MREPHGSIDTVARVAIGLIVLRVLDDSFVHRPSGVDLRDHLASGLVPTVVLLAAAVAFRRVRYGARAAIAAACGVFGLLWGSELFMGAAENTRGFQGDDYTSVLSLVAGLVLIGLSIVIAWTSRRSQGNLLWRVTRRSLIGALVAAIAFLVVLPLGVSYYATHSSGEGLTSAPDLGVPSSAVRMRTPDGLWITGWYAPSRNGAAVIVLPGSSGQTQAAVLAGHGYGVLLVNRRGEADSEGDPNLFGWGGNYDITAAVDFLRARPEVEPERIGGIGFSVGGEMLLQYAAESTSLAAVVSEGAGSRSIKESLELSGGMRVAELASAPVMSGSLILMSDQMAPPNLAALLRDMDPKPMFLIWGEKGQPAEIDFGPIYADAAPFAQSWEIPGAGHIGGLRTAPEDYEHRVVEFFDQSLPDGAP
jgi:uncharacterized protein